MEIIASLGQRCRTVELLRGLQKVGMTGIRLNLAHCEISDYKDVLTWGVQTGMKIVFDLEGENFRVGNILREFRLKAKDKAFLCLERDYEELSKRSSRFNDEDIKIDDGLDGYIPVKSLKDLNQLYEGEKCYISKNNIALLMVKRHLDYMECEVISSGGVVRTGRSINFPKVDRNNKLQEKDKKNLDLIKFLDDCVVVHALSEMQDEILEVREYISNKKIKVFSKIKTLGGLKNWKLLYDVSDGMVLDRNDLSSDVGFWAFPKYQGRLISALKNAGNEFWATGGLLDSQNYISGDLPSLSELSEIVNLMKNGASGFILTETANSERPKRVVKTISLIHEKVFQ